MKKNLFILSAIAVTAAALVSCEKEQDVNVKEEPQGIPFEIVAGAIETKTVNDDMSTNWVAGDQINLFHAVNGETTYVDDGAFEAAADGASVSFTGTLGAALASGNYDWFAVYPYNAGFDTPAGTATITIPAAQTQVGNSSKAHLAGANCPVAGNKKNVAYDATPVIDIKHLTSIIKVHVTNKIASDITVSGVSFTAPFNINGAFNLDLTGDSPALSGLGTSATTALTVTSGAALATDESADFYLAVKPFGVSAGAQLSLTVSTNAGDQTLTTVMPAGYTFAVGKIATLNFNFTNKASTLVQFKYDDGDWLDAQGIVKPSAGSGTDLDGTMQKVSPVYVAVQKPAGNAPKLWNDGGNYEIRAYNNNKLVVASFDDKMITKITFVGACPASAEVGTLTPASKTWTGRAGQVTFSFTATTKINSINVFYEAAEESDHVLEIPTTAFSVAYNATSLDIPIFVANATGLEATSSSSGFTSATPSVTNGKVAVVMEANASSSPRDIVVTISSTAPAVSTDVTITQAGAPVTTLAGVKALYSDSPVLFTATLTDALVTTVSGTTFFMEDASGGIKGVVTGHGLAVGNKINGTITGTVTKTNGNYQLTTLDKSGATITTGNTVTPTTVDAATLASNFASYESMLVKVAGVEVSAVSNKNVTLDGIDGFIVYNNSDLSLPVGSQFNAVGPATYYNSTKEIAIYTVEESDRISIVPTITATNTTVAVGGTVTIVPTSNSTGAFTYTSLDTEIATVDENTGVVTGVGAGTVTINIAQAAVGGGSYWAAGSGSVSVEVTASVKKYNKVDAFTSGKTYLIVNASKGKVMPHPGSSGATLTAGSVTISDNKITRTAETQACEFTITTETIESTAVQIISYKDGSTTYYLKGYNGSSTKGNLGRDTSKPTALADSNYRVWLITTTTSHGSFNIKNRNVDSGNRSIIYNTSGTKFGDYLDSNLNGTQYFNVDLFELED